MTPSQETKFKALILFISSMFDTDFESYYDLDWALKEIEKIKKEK